MGFVIRRNARERDGNEAQRGSPLASNLPVLSTGAKRTASTTSSTRGTGSLDDALRVVTAIGGGPQLGSEKVK